MAGVPLAPVAAASPTRAAGAPSTRAGTTARGAAATPPARSAGAATAGASAEVLHAPVVRGTKGFRETTIARLPAGKSPAQLGPTEPGCCGKHDAAGAAFLGRDGRLYFHDDVHRNLKVLDVRRATSGRFEVRAGFGGSEGDLTEHGVADSAGNVFLVTQEGQPGVACTIWSLPAGASRWSALKLAPDDPRWWAIALPVATRARLQLLPTGEVALHDWRGGERVLVGRAGRLVDTTRVSLGKLPEELSASGWAYGRDARGREFRLGQSLEGFVYEVRDPAGRRLASMLRPEVPLWKSLAGEAEGFVTPEGDLVVARVVDRALVVSRYTPDLGAPADSSAAPR